MAKKIGYLTIDDAPSKNFVDKIDFLIEKNIPAILFCEGRKLEKRMEKAIYAIKRGFIIGNHSYDHIHFSKATLKECYRQIKKTDQLIEQAYKKAGVKRPIKVFRFPYLDKGWGSETADKGISKDPKKRKHAQSIQKYLKKLGYKQPKFEGVTYKWYKKLLEDIDVYCTYDTFDWCLEKGKSMFNYHDLPTILARMDENFPEKCRGLNFPNSNEIIMMHSWIPNKAFKTLIKRLLKKGIKFKLPKT